MYPDFVLDQAQADYLENQWENIQENLWDVMEKIQPLGPKKYERWHRAILNAYKFADYGPINRIFSEISQAGISSRRANTDETDPMIYLYAKYISILITNICPRIPVPTVFYRGIKISKQDSAGFLRTFEPGNEIVFPEFMSTSPFLRLARSFAMNSQVDGLSVMFILRMPAGMPALIYGDLISRDGREQEAVLPNCTRWLVSNISSDDMTYVELVFDGLGMVTFPNQSQNPVQNLQDTILQIKDLSERQAEVKHEIDLYKRTRSCSSFASLVASTYEQPLTRRE